MKDAKYYFNLIDKKLDNSDSLTYLFEQLEEITDSSCINKLLSYTTGSIHTYSHKKYLALGLLGDIADKQSEEQIIRYMSSNHPDLVSAAFSSVGEMAIRNVLSKNALSDLIAYIKLMIMNHTGGSEGAFHGLYILK